MKNIKIVFYYFQELLKDLFGRSSHVICDPDGEKYIRNFSSHRKKEDGEIIIDETLHVQVNYNLDEGKVIEATNCRYDRVNNNVSAKNFPTTRTGVAERDIQLVYCNKWGISTSELLKKLDEIGLYPIERHELLAIGAQYPDKQREYLIPALGSVWQNSSDSKCYSPCLHGHGGVRLLDVICYNVLWLTGYRIAVKKYED